MVYNQRISNPTIDKPDFKFSLSFLARHTELTNEEGYAKLIQSVLNALSIWLNICILDIYIYLNKSFDYVEKFYWYLIRLRNHLSSLLVCRADVQSE